MHRFVLRVFACALCAVALSGWIAPLAAGEPSAPPAPPPSAVDSSGVADFRPNAVLSDGSQVAALWPGPKAGDGKGPTWTDPQGAKVAGDKVIRVLYSNTPPPAAITQGATTFDGQRLIGSVDAYSEKDGLKVTSPVLGPVTIPAALLSRIYIQETVDGEEDELPVGLTRPGTDAAQPQKDLVVYRNADQSQSRLFFLADGAAKLKRGDDITTAPLERLAFITLAAPQKMPAGDRELLVLLTDGSRITGDVAAATPEQLTLNSSVGTLKIPRPLIHSLWPHRAGYRLLSRAQPTQVKNYGQFDVSFPPRINRSAAGRPFQAAEFNLAGIGMHSFTRAEYNLDGAAAFVTFVTLDLSAQPQASCAVRVYIDGAKKFETELSAKTPGKYISVPTAGAKTMALEVDFGGDQSDTGDLVDWINAVLLQ